MITSGITKEELIGWGGVETFNQGFALCNTNAVHDVEYDDDTLIVSGKITQKDGWDMPVSFKLMPGGRIQSNCPCYANQEQGRVCPHVLAVGIALWVLEMDAPLATPKAPKSPVPNAPLPLPAAHPDPADEPFIEVPAAPRFFALLAGSRASLSIAVDVQYDKAIRFPACSVQKPRAVWLNDPDDSLVRRVRNARAEDEATQGLRTWGFEPGYRDNDLKFYLTDPQKVLTFLGTGIPEYRRRGWRFAFSPKLDALLESLPTVLSTVTIRDAPNDDFDVTYVFKTDKGQVVSPAEIQAALNRHDGYLLKDGQVTLLDINGVEALRDVFRDCAASQNGARRGWFRVRRAYAPYVRSSLEAISDCIDFNDNGAPHWRAAGSQADASGAVRYQAIDLGRLENILRPYQKQGVYWMRFLECSGLSGLLADEMGLGKTLQTLCWLSLPRHSPDARRAEGGNLPALIVCPTSLVRNWEAEAEKFTPWLKTLVVSGPDRAAAFPRIPEADVVITSYALLQRDQDAAYLGRNFSALVLDEAQHIKNRQTRNAIAVKGLSSACRLALTGTPVENSVTDVWSIFDFLMPDYLGDYDAFKVNFEDPIAEGGDETPVTLARLKRKISPFILRRLKKTVAQDLPDKIVKVSYCPMDDLAQREYARALDATRTMAGDMIREKGFAKSQFALLAMLMKLRQIASRGKTDTVMEQLVSASEAGHKILVFSQFVKMLKELEKRLREAGIPYCYLDGSTKDRLAECNRFNRTPEIPIFLISLMAGGTGLNLTSADMVVHYDPWWNPAVEDQATDRAHRIGQRKTVYVMKMIAADTIEERVLALQRRKQAVISATVDTTDAAVMEKLTAADLNELLS